MADYDEMDSADEKPDKDSTKSKSGVEHSAKDQLSGELGEIDKLVMLLLQMKQQGSMAQPPGNFPLGMGATPSTPPTPIPSGMGLPVGPTPPQGMGMPGMPPPPVSAMAQQMRGAGGLV